MAPAKGSADGTADVRHKWYPFDPDVMERSYTDEELANIDPPPFTFEGKEYSAYDATQMQRKLETAMRAQERKMIGCEAAGDKKAYTAAKAKYRALSAKYKAFSKAADLPEQRQRLKIAESSQNSLAIHAKGGNINFGRDAFMPANEKVAIPESARDDFTDFEPLTLSKTERAAADEIHDLASKTGNEYGIAVINGKSSTPFSSDLPDKIYIPKEYRQTPGTKLFHSHTNVTPPSRGDLRHLTNPNIDEICAVTANGDVFTVSRGYGELVSEEVYDEIVSEIADKVDREIKTVNGFYDWTAPERNYMAIREQFFRICREFGWTMKGGKL